MRNNIKFNGKYGYTLLEVIVVLALFAIIFSISVPSMKAFFSIMEKKELMEFKRDLLSARNSAIVNSKNYTFFTNSSGNYYYITEQSTKTNIIKSVELSSGLKIKNNFDVKFTPSGAPAGAGTIVLYDSKDRKIEITITPATGKVNIYKDR